MDRAPVASGDQVPCKVQHRRLLLAMRLVVASRSSVSGARHMQVVCAVGDADQFQSLLGVNPVVIASRLIRRHWHEATGTDWADCDLRSLCQHSAVRMLMR